MRPISEVGWAQSRTDPTDGDLRAIYLCPRVTLVFKVIVQYLGQCRADDEHAMRLIKFMPIMFVFPELSALQRPVISDSGFVFPMLLKFFELYQNAMRLGSPNAPLA